MSLPSFEGPLDLLLHLCQKHELDILDIPIGFVTEKYLEYLAVMQYLDLDVASEYLVMAATLAHIKSKMLLPAAPPGEDDESLAEEADPRESLIRRLLEYQKYKQAAMDLAGRGVTANDVFGRGMPMEAAVHTGEPPLAQVPLFSLVEAFQSVLAKSKVKLSHDIVHERITLTDRINELVDLLRVHKRLAFDQLFEGLATKFDLIITFLALLEMTKLRMTKLFQADLNSPIYVEFSAQVEETEVTHGGPDERAEAEETKRATGEEPTESGAGSADGTNGEYDEELEELHADLHAALYGEEAAEEVRDLFRIGTPEDGEALAEDAGDGDSAPPAEAGAVEASDAEPHTAEAAPAAHEPFEAETSLVAGEPAIAEEPSTAEEPLTAGPSVGTEVPLSVESVESVEEEDPFAAANPLDLEVNRSPEEPPEPTPAVGDEAHEEVEAEPDEAEPDAQTQATSAEAAKESEAPVDSLADNASMVPQGTESDEDPK